jgi:hypothetical protein
MDAHEREQALARSLRAVAEDEEQLRSSSAVGMRLLAEVHGIGQARRRRTTAISLSSVAAMLVLVAVWGGFRGTPQPREADPPAVVTRELVTEFFPLPYSNVPARGGYVVRMQVPPEALAAFAGTAAFGESNSGRSGHVLADVVIGDDGLARAVRFVQVVSNDQQEQTR